MEEYIWKKNLPNNEEENPTLVGLLNTIFTSPLSSDEKIKRLENVYNIPRTEKIKEGVAKMCNLSSGILEEGRAEGRAEGKSVLITSLRELNHSKEQIMEQLMKRYNLTMEEANQCMQECL